MTPLSAGIVGQQVMHGKCRQEMLNNAGHSAGGKIRDDVKNTVLVSIDMSSKTIMFFTLRIFLSDL